MARIVPIDPERRRGGRRERLVRAGLLVPGRGRVRASLHRPPSGSPGRGHAVLEALLEERREGR